MFFTRDVKHRLQQDTYIQRARMFGSRESYLKYFELTIPKSLYLDWQTCFIFHRLSLESRRQNKRSPVWLDGERISAVAASSIDKTNVLVDKGEMSFALFDYRESEIKEVKNEKLEREGVFDPGGFVGPDPRMEQVIQAVTGLTRQVSQLANQVEELRKKVSG